MAVHSSHRCLLNLINFPKSFFYSQSLWTSLTNWKMNNETLWIWSASLCLTKNTQESNQKLISSQFEQLNAQFNEIIKLETY